MVVEERKGKNQTDVNSTTYILPIVATYTLYTSSTFGLQTKDNPIKEKEKYNQVVLLIAQVTSNISPPEALALLWTGRL